MISRRHFLAASAASLAASPMAAWSNQPIRLVVGFTAGGSADFVARQLALYLAEELNTPVVVDNRPGAGGRIAVDVVKNAKPDGNTLLVSPGAILTIYPHVYRQLSYNPLTDLMPISSLCALQYSANIGPMVPDSVTSLEQLVQWFKANPDKASFGSAGAGTAMHFLGEMFAAQMGLNYVHVPYKGGAMALQDVMAGQIASSFNVISEPIAQLSSGKVRMLGVSSAERLSQLPQVPAFAEQGLPALTSQEWMGLLAPKGTSPELVARLHAAAAKSLSGAKVQAALAEMAFSMTPMSQADFARMMEQDIAKWAPVVERTGFKADA